jgi:hypothetical protein
MKQSKIAMLTADGLRPVLQAVEDALKQSSKPTKALVVKTLANQGLCSESSSGTEKTLISAAAKLNLTVPPTLSILMGEATPRAAAGSPGTPAPQLPSTGRMLLCLKSVSQIDAVGGRAKIIFNDGTKKSCGSFDVSAFRSSCNLIEFNVS